MEQTRISCPGKSRDCWWSSDGRLFWFSNRYGYWELHSGIRIPQRESLDSQVYATLGTVYEGLAVNRLLSNDYWWVVFSIDGNLEVVGFDSGVSRVVYQSTIGQGKYPRMFWNKEISRGILLYTRNDIVYGRYTTNWETYGDEVISWDFYPEGVGYMSLQDGEIEKMSVVDWINLYKEINDMKIRNNVPYLGKEVL